VVTSHARRVQGYKAIQSEHVTIKKGSFHVREMVDATIADRDEVMKLDDMGRCGIDNFTDK
jgi:hypothetical protein